MLLKRVYLFYLISFFFIIANIYWLPFLSIEFISKFKFLVLLLLLILFSIFFVKKERKYNINDMWIILAFVFSLFYQILSGVSNFSYFIMFLSFLIFYYMGKNAGSYSLNNFGISILFLMYLWVFLSFFIPSLNYRNSLLLDYEFSEVMLSSTGFSLARTSWGIGISLLTLYYIHYTSSVKLKTILFILAFLCILTTGSRGGIIYFLVASVFFIYFKKINANLKIITTLILMLTIYLFYYYFGEFFRFKGGEDFSNGRSSNYNYFSDLISNNYIFGYYPKGGYSLTNYGFQYDHIHNAWLNFLLNYGILGSLPVLVILFIFLKNIFGGDYSEKISLYLIVLIGILSTFIEPDTIFSNGYHVLLFWFTLGLLAQSRKNL